MYTRTSKHPVDWYSYTRAKEHIQEQGKLYKSMDKDQEQDKNFTNNEIERMRQLSME